MPTYYKVKVEVNQSIVDIAIQEYGNPQAVFLLADDNPDVITDLNVDLQIGDELVIRNEVDDLEYVDLAVRNHFGSLNRKISNGSLPNPCENGGIGCWIVELDNIVQ